MASLKVQTLVAVAPGLHTKHFRYDFLPIIEYVFQLAFDEELGDVAEWFERQAIANVVFHQRFARFGFGKAVQVYPLFVRPAELRVLKFERRLPTRNLSPPAKGQAVHRQLVIDQSAFFDINRPRRDDVKAELGRRDAFEIFRV